jgi:hypothetical protein
VKIEAVTPGPESRSDADNGFAVADEWLDLERPDVNMYDHEELMSV